ncbi:MAG TPA: nucleotidyltransferase domain-containing protein [Geminicoccaceae bacterium]|nr:nucleotidyltransferase domain-containing protein [Geminicoccaceae bacterium]
MTTTPTSGEPERARVLAALRGQAAELRRRGVRRLRLTGSVARGEASPASDVDLIAEIDCAAVARFSLLDLAALELDLADALGREVQIVTALDELHPLVRASLEAPAIEVLDGR